MGVCASSEETQIANGINKQIALQKSSDGSVKKLLLLGAGGSGKSTLFKQLKTIHGPGITEKERASFKDIVYNNVIDGMKTLIEKNRELQEPDYVYYRLITDAERESLKMQPETEESAEFVEYLRNDVNVNEEIARHVEILWADLAFKNTFELRSKFQIQDSASYFWDNVRRIAAPGYIPTEEDVLRARVRTTGIVEQEFMVQGNVFQIFDVGGQRNERKKWIHCFENVTGVIFVGALSSYDQVLFEDEQTNRMLESVNLFGEICNNRWFTETAMILFLNKVDLFEEKIKKIPLDVCFRDYPGPKGSKDDAIQYIRDYYLAQNKHPKEKQVFCHVTCATDKDNIQTVFKDVQHVIITTSLKKAALM